MDWVDVNQNLDRMQDFVTTLQASGSQYDSVNTDDLIDLISRKQAQYYLWDTVPLQIAVGLHKNKTLQRWKVAHCTPAATVPMSANEAVKIAWAQVRQFMDSKGAESFYAIVESFYDSQNTNKFLQEIVDISHELKAEKFDGRVREWSFERTPASKLDDANWVGSGVSVSPFEE